ncbi:imidazolonepropionase, partial [Mesorhizobium sp. USDA-HM6]
MMGGENGKSGLRLWRNARLATMAEGVADLGIVEKGAVAARDGLIVYAGAEAGMPAGLAHSAETVDCEGRWITPGLIDCHTHLVYAGNRANEFEMRLAGATYEEVARAGGGIVSSVKSLRAASEDQLVAETLPRLDALLAEGVTTVEVKSGYGLDLDNEKKSLRAARRLDGEREVTIRATCLAAHALPPEAKGDKDAFIDRVAGTILPEVAAENLADAVDGFCEGIAFSPEQIAR